MTRTFTQINDAKLEVVVGGTRRAPVLRIAPKTTTKVNNSSISLSNMTIYAGVSGKNNLGGLTIGVTQGIQ